IHSFLQKAGPAGAERWFIVERGRGKSRLYSSSMTAISLDRFRTRIETLARFGALPGGGVTRSAWSPAHEEARAWLVDEMRAAGLEPWVDAAGNVFGGLGVRAFDAARPAGVTGSDLDTRPPGGIPRRPLGLLA